MIYGQHGTTGFLRASLPNVSMVLASGSCPSFAATTDKTEIDAELIRIVTDLLDYELQSA